MTLHEKSAPKASEPDSGDKIKDKEFYGPNGEKRKPNYFERNRLVNYE